MMPGRLARVTRSITIVRSEHSGLDHWPVRGVTRNCWVTRWGRPVALGLSVLGLVVFAFWFALLLAHADYRWVVGIDRAIYRDAALRWLGGGAWYLPDQLAGPYPILVGHVLYPPVALLWFIPAAFLPDLLWWAIPIGTVAWVVARHRPALWAWPVMAACLAYNWTPQIIVAGNPSMWIAAAIAAGTLGRPAFAFVLLKPSLFPLALLGVRSRGWWISVVAVTALSLLTLPMMLDYLRALLNARGPLATILYSARDLPMLAIPLIAWAGRGRA